MRIHTIYEDEFFLVIDKPAGVVVNRAATVKRETIQDWAEEKLKVKSEKLKVEEGDFYHRAGIVHRLDKETSGLLIIAKTPETFYSLQSQFKQRLITKKYIALVHGRLMPEEGQIKASIGRLPWNREKFGIIPGGKTAVTLYKVISRYKFDGCDFALLWVMPYTGRTHQIRVHLKYLQHPIVADHLYVGRKTYRQDLKFCPRLFLHASYLKIKHPVSQEWVEVKRSLPKDLKGVIEKFTGI